MTIAKHSTIHYDFDYCAGSPIWDDQGRLLGCQAIELSNSLSRELEHLADDYTIHAWPAGEQDPIWWKSFMQKSDELLEKLLKEIDSKGITVLVYAGPEKSWIH